MLKGINDYINECLNESATLFGDIDDYKMRFREMLPSDSIKRVEEQGATAVIPDEFINGYASKGNWRKDGWNYANIMIDILDTEENRKKFTKSKDVVNHIYDTVIKQDKKSWTALGVKKPMSKFDFNKNDLASGYENPALGFIFFDIFDSSTDGRMRNNYLFRIRGSFMNQNQSWGEITKLGINKEEIDTLIAGDKKRAAAIKNYIESFYL